MQALDAEESGSGRSPRSSSRRRMSPPRRARARPRTTTLWPDATPARGHRAAARRARGEVGDRAAPAGSPEVLKHSSPSAKSRSSSAWLPPSSTVSASGAN